VVSVAEPKKVYWWIDEHGNAWGCWYHEDPEKECFRDENIDFETLIGVRIVDVVFTPDGTPIFYGEEE
jgi:hypothetical protein